MVGTWWGPVPTSQYVPASLGWIEQFDCAARNYILIFVKKLNTAKDFKMFKTSPVLQKTYSEIVERLSSEYILSFQKSESLSCSPHSFPNPQILNCEFSRHFLSNQIVLTKNSWKFWFWISWKLCGEQLNDSEKLKYLDNNILVNSP